MKLFGQKKKDPKEVLRENQRDLKRTERTMDRESSAMKKQEQQLINDIKKAAKDGNEASARVLAKQLVRIRSQMNRTTVMKAQVKGVASGMALANSQAHMVEGMSKAGKAMAAMNAQMDPQEMARMMNEFTKQNEAMEMKQEIMDDTLDGLFDDDGLEEEADAVTQQVLDEIGLDQFGKMAVAKGKRPAQQVTEQEGAEEESDDLAARLAALRS